MPDELDQSEERANILRDANISNRVQYGKWDGQMRECKECKNPIPVGRLRAINAFTCIDCAKRIL